MLSFSFYCYHKKIDLPSSLPNKQGILNETTIRGGGHEKLFRVPVEHSCIAGAVAALMERLTTKTLHAKHVLQNLRGTVRKTNENQVLPLTSGAF